MSARARIAAIELAGDEVRLAVIKTGGRLPKVLGLYACRAQYADPEQRTEALIDAVKDVVARANAHAAAYVLCISSFHSIVRTLTIPFRGARKVAAAVQFELEPYLAFPIEELVVDFSTVLEADGQTDVLAVGLRRAVIAEHLAILNAAGIDPDSIDIDALGLTGLWTAMQSRRKGLHAVLHVRDAGSILAITSDKKLAYFRFLSFDAAQMTAHPVAAAREVGNSLRAFQVGWRGTGPGGAPAEIASLCVTGSIFTDSLAERERFEHEFDVPITYEPMLARLKAVPHPEVSSVRLEAAPKAPGLLESISEDALASGIEGQGSAGDVPEAEEPHVEAPASPMSSSNVWEAVVGVAMGAAGGGYAMNFRKDDLAPRNVARGIVPHILVASCLALLLLAGVAWFYHDARARNIAAGQEIQTQIDALEQEVAQLKNEGVNVSMEYFSDPSLLDILNEIAQRMPNEKAAITDIRVERPESGDSMGGDSGAQQPWITIRGKVIDDAKFGQAVDSLKQSPMMTIDEPELKLEKNESTFKIVARRKTTSAT